MTAPDSPASMPEAGIVIVEDFPVVRDGLALMERITRELPSMKILVLSMMNEAV